MLDISGGVMRLDFVNQEEEEGRLLRSATHASKCGSSNQSDDQDLRSGMRRWEVVIGQPRVQRGKRPLRNPY